jgi:AraC-like DNA-binding protein
VLLGRPPCSALQPYVKWLWLAEAYVPGPHDQERILPTGESALVIDLGSRGVAGFSGPHSRSFVIDVASQFSVAGVQFAPGGAFPFVDIPQVETVDQHVPLGSLSNWPATFRERVLEARTPQQRLDVIEAALVAMVARGRGLHPAIRYAVRVLEPGTATLPVADLVDRVGLSHRRFLDLFAAQVGLTPKRFARVRRFQHALRRLRAGGPVHWADVALSCGYYDQAHFIHEFKEFSGVNPTTYQGLGGLYANHLRI